MSDGSVFQSRVRQRIAALKISPIRLAQDVGLDRGYINDIIVGRKKNISRRNLPLVAKALQCDPEYLLGKQDEVRIPGRSPLRTSNSQRSGLRFGGICETGVWKSPAAQTEMLSADPAPMEPDPKYDGMPQVAYMVRGDGMGGAQIKDGMWVTGVDGDAWQREIGPLESGMIVAVRALRGPGDGDAELSLRRLSYDAGGMRLKAQPSRSDVNYDDAITGPGTTIEAVITRAVLSVIG